MYALKIIVILLLTVNLAHAQQNSVPRIQPPFDFSNATSVKVTKNSDGKLELSYSKPVLHLETKTRTVKNDAGKEIEERYASLVEWELQHIQVQLKDVQAWRINGERLSVDQIQAALSTQTIVFLMEHNGHSEYHADPFYVSLMDRDSLVLRIDRPLERSNATERSDAK